MVAEGDREYYSAIVIVVRSPLSRVAISCMSLQAGQVIEYRNKGSLAPKYPSLHSIISCSL